MDTPPASPAPPPAPSASRLPGPARWVLENRGTALLALAVLATFTLAWRDPGTSTIKLPFSQAVYVKYGGYAWEAVRERGEWWRFFSTLFVPRWGLDAVIYVWMVISLVPALERALGTARLLALVLIAGAGGVGLGEVFSPSDAYMPGTMISIFGLLGAIPGLALGRTGSLSRAASDPNAQSAAFWLALWLVVGFFMGGKGWNLPAILGASVIAAALSAGLASFGRSLPFALALSAVGAAAGLGAVGLAAGGQRWRDGKLVDRGRPAGARSGPVRGGDPAEAPTSGPSEATLRRADALRAQYEPGLERFGPIPSGEGVSDADYVAVRGWLRELEAEVESPTSGITGELDDLRVRCLLVLGQRDAAARLAEEMVVMQGTPRARALAGAASFFKGSLELALEQLEAALVADPALERAWPEVRYYHAATLLRLGGDDEATASSFRRYLELVGSGDPPGYRVPLIARARAQLELR